MPFPFVLPTTSAFSFPSCLSCGSHPSLPVEASTYRAIVRDALKKHKRLPPSAQSADIPTVISALNQYVPYLLTVCDGLVNKSLPSGEFLSIILETEPKLEWRPTLTGDAIPGRERPRVKITSLDHEKAFVLSTLGYCHILTARATLQPLYSIRQESLSPQQRTNAITTATKSLLEAASIYEYAIEGTERATRTPPCPDVSPNLQRALGYVAHAEATLLAVLKDDPYPAAVAQDRNQNDKEWMFKAPDIPKVRAHLYARLCLAAAGHATTALSLCKTAGLGSQKIDPDFIKYLEDLRRTSRAKACRFFGIDSELGGETAEGIGWLRAGLQELGVEVKDNKKGLSFSRFKKEFTEKREDRRVEKETTWGADAGRLEEARVLEMLDVKWNKINDTVSSTLFIFFFVAYLSYR